MSKLPNLYLVHHVLHVTSEQETDEKLVAHCQATVRQYTAIRSLARELSTYIGPIGARPAVEPIRPTTGAVCESLKVLANFT